mgnify:FL=1
MRKNSNCKVICRNQERGTMQFYLLVGAEKFYLFSTRYYSKKIYQEFSGGKPLDVIFRNSRDTHRQKIQERIILMLRYLEAAYFGTVTWEIVPGTPYERAILGEVDKTTPEYRAFYQKSVMVR